MDNDNDHNLFSVFAELKLKIGDMADSAKRMQRLQKQALMFEQMVQFRPAAQGTIASDNLTVIDLGCPNRGYFWNVRSIVVTGQTPDATAAGTAYVFVTASDLRLAASTGQLPIGDFQDIAANIPLRAEYSKGSLVCRSGEHLYVVFDSSTTGQICVANAMVEVYQEHAFSEVQ